jgi:hypothetical protein
MMRPEVVAKMAIAIASLALSSSPDAQDIFTTEDYLADRERWTDPAYYRNNTVFEIRDMDRDSEFGERGTGVDGAASLVSPYPYTSAWEHYEAWLGDADGGTRHTRESVPDWSGRFRGGWDRLDGGPNPASAIVPMLAPEYQEAFVQDMVALATGRTWGANAFCLPGGFMTAVRDAEEFIVTHERVWILSEGNKGGLTEFSDELETVERYWRVGDTIEGEITLYDPIVLVRPAYSRLAYELDTDTRPELRPLYNSCTDTNGPAPKIHMDERGILNERLPGDPLYWDATDPRPWATWLDESDARFKTYRESLGTGSDGARGN